MIKKILPSIIMGLGLVLMSSNVNSQLNYTVSFPTATYTAITGTTPTLTMAYPLAQAATEGVPNTDEGAANGIAIPFPFKFNGLPYTTVNISTNGFISLGSKLDTFDIYYANNLSSGPNGNGFNSLASRPIIAPLWDDLDMQAATNIKYTTTGTTPNRIFTVQWTNAKWTWTATSASMSFQVKLYEVDNSIMFHYKPINAGTLSTSAGASVGLADGPTGSGNFLSMSGLTNAATNSSTTETTTIAAKPANNFAILFTPIPTPAIDAALKLYAAPVRATCISTPQTLKYIIRNTGTNSIAPGAAVVNVNLTGANPATFNVSNSKTLAFNEYDTVTINNVNLNNPGSTPIIGVVALAGDTKATNDSSKYSYSTATTLTSFPLNDGGDLTAFNWLYFRYGGNNGWRLGGPNAYYNSALGDSLYPYSGSDFYYFNPVSSAALSNSYLYTQCLTLPAGMPASNYYCSFWMSHDSSRADAAGFGSDSLFISVSTDGAQTWTRLAGFDRIRAGFDLPGWAKDSVDLSAYAGQTIHVGLEGVGNYGNVFGVDDIEIGANYPLPVTLSNFTGNKEGLKNVLKWETVNETNNKGFELQRSINGKDFGKIGEIASKATNGTSSTKLNYTFTDATPITSATNYYRLRQIDINGKESFSNVVAIKLNEVVKAQISRIYPNPVQDKLNVLLSTTAAEKMTVVITDLIGKTITQQTTEAVQGDNNVSFNTTQLAKGTYVVKVFSTQNAEIASQKFVKQ